MKRIHDWSSANLAGGFAADLLWKRSDGRELGRVVARGEMEEMVDLIEATSDEKTDTVEAIGILVGGDLRLRGGLSISSSQMGMTTEEPLPRSLRQRER